MKKHCNECHNYGECVYSHEDRADKCKVYFKVNEIKESAMIEEYAELEHKQWMSWAKTISKTEKISSDRLARWKKLMIPYSKLPEEVKEQDREYARHIHAIVLTRIWRLQRKLSKHFDRKTKYEIINLIKAEFWM
jgi:hypothetical protein